MVWIDGSDLKGMLSELYLLIVLGDLCNFKVRAVDGLEELVLVIHGLYAGFDVLEVLLVVWVGFDEFDHFFALWDWHGEAKLQESEVLDVGWCAHSNYNKYESNQ